MQLNQELATDLLFYILNKNKSQLKYQLNHHEMINHHSKCIKQIKDLQIILKDNKK